MQTPAHDSAQRWAQRLTALGHAVRKEIFRQRGAAGLHVPVEIIGGDTIYEIDKRVEPIILEHATRWADGAGTIELVAEGLGESGREVFQGASGELPGQTWDVMIDPIDGTRNIMYDKRSAWFLATAAPGDPGNNPPMLSRCIASVMVELPTAKSNRVDDFAMFSGGKPVCVRTALDTLGDPAGEPEQIGITPSTAATLRHGWGQVTNFFPGTKVLAAELMERIAAETLGEILAGEALVFDDQYLTTGGQLVELMCGRDRFCCDLRPLMFEIVRTRGGATADGLCCHPYDMAGLLVAKQSGIIITDGFGRDLDAPFGVDHNIHWCGYANRSLRSAIEPIIHAWLREHGVVFPM